MRFREYSSFLNSYIHTSRPTSDDEHSLCSDSQNRTYMRSKRGLAYWEIVAHNTIGGGSHERARFRSPRKGEEMKSPRNRILGELVRVWEE